MYYAVATLSFDPETFPIEDAQLLKPLADKLRTNFKVAAHPGPVEDIEQSPMIVVAAITPTEEQMNRLLDKITEFCEQAGYGRIIDERSIVEPLDALGGE